MIALLVAAGLLAVAAPAVAGVSPSTASGARVTGGSVSIFGGDFTLPADEIREGDLVVYGGTVNVEGTVSHDVTVFGGDVTVNGRVGHDVSVVGGSLHLGPAADIGHDATVVGGTLDRDPGARIGHRLTEGGRRGVLPGLGHVPFAPPIAAPFVWLPGPRGFDFGGGLAVAAGLVLLALLLHLFFPAHVATAREALAARPLASLGFGCLTAMAGALLAAFLAITIILLPVSLAITIAMAVGVLLGWTALIVLVGQRLTAALGWRVEPVATLLIGGLIVAVIVNVPLLGGLFGLVAGAMALGAAVLTRFGTRPAPAGPPLGPVPPFGPPPSYGPPPPQPQPPPSQSPQPAPRQQPPPSREQPSQEQPSQEQPSQEQPSQEQPRPPGPS